MSLVLCPKCDQFSHASDDLCSWCAFDFRTWKKSRIEKLLQPFRNIFCEKKCVSKKAWYSLLFLAWRYVKDRRRFFAARPLNFPDDPFLGQMSDAAILNVALIRHRKRAFPEKVEYLWERDIQPYIDLLMIFIGVVDMYDFTVEERGRVMKFFLSSLNKIEFIEHEKLIGAFPSKEIILKRLDSDLVFNERLSLYGDVYEPREH